MHEDLRRWCTTRFGRMVEEDRSHGHAVAPVMSSRSFILNVLANTRDSRNWRVKASTYSTLLLQSYHPLWPLALCFTSTAGAHWLADAVYSFGNGHAVFGTDRLACSQTIRLRSGSDGPLQSCGRNGSCTSALSQLKQWPVLELHRITVKDAWQVYDNNKIILDKFKC